MNFVGIIDNKYPIYLTEFNNIVMSPTMQEIDSKTLLLLERANNLKWADPSIREDIYQLITPTDEVFDLSNITYSPPLDLTAEVESILLEEQTVDHTKNNEENNEENKARKITYALTISFSFIIILSIYLLFTTQKLF